MKTSITFKQIDSSNAVKDFINEHVERIAKYDLKAMELHLTLTKERHLHVVEAELHAKDFRAHAEGSTTDIYTSINDALDRLEKILQKRHDKIKKHRTEAQF